MNPTSLYDKNIKYSINLIFITFLERVCYIHVFLFCGLKILKRNKIPSFHVNLSGDYVEFFVYLEPKTNFSNF
jgi:hypothetical protein